MKLFWKWRNSILIFLCFELWACQPVLNIQTKKCSGSECMPFDAYYPILHKRKVRIYYPNGQLSAEYWAAYTTKGLEQKDTNLALISKAGLDYASIGNKGYDGKYTYYYPNGTIEREGVLHELRPKGRYVASEIRYDSMGRKNTVLKISKKYVCRTLDFGELPNPFGTGRYAKLFIPKRQEFTTYQTKGKLGKADSKITTAYAYKYLCWDSTNTLTSTIHHKYSDKIIDDMPRQDESKYCESYKKFMSAFCEKHIYPLWHIYQGQRDISYIYCATCDFPGKKQVNRRRYKK